MASGGTGNLNSPRYRGLLLVGLGIALVLFYTTFVTARTYYNPSATALILLLGGFIVVGGLFLGLQRERSARAFFSSALISKVRRIFPLLLLSTIVALTADVLLTLYAVSNFGYQVEANRVVVSLIGRGDLLAWLGQQFGPTLLSGALFGLFKNVYTRTMIAAFTLGTLGYAVATVLNDLLVVYDLSVPRA